MNKNRLHTHIEISREALLHNVRQLKKLCFESRLGVVIKSNAYGHGIELVGSVLEKCDDVDRLFVIGIDEGLVLRAAGITKKILALAYHDASVEEAILNDIDITLHDADAAFVAELDRSARACGKKVRVHVKIDTGLTRLGLREPDKIIRYVELLMQYVDTVDLVGIFTHLADPNNPDPAYTHEQLDRFNGILKSLRERGIHIPVTHALSSGGLALVRPPLVMQKDTYVYTTTRIGTNIYGLWKSDAQKKFIHACDPSIALKPVLTWKARILSTCFVTAGQSVGYARTYIAPHDSSVAMISVGYADGYPRALSGKSRVMIGSAYAPVVGLISMNILAIDVTGIPGAVPGAEVTLFGDAPCITVDEVARHAGILNNELVARINPLISRSLVV